MTAPSPARDTFHPESLNAAVAGLRRKQVFFIGGAPKSGTTWLQLLLDAHPAVSCTGEGHFPDRLLPMLQRALREYNAAIHFKNREVFQGVANQALFGPPHASFLAVAAISLALLQPAKSAAASVVGDKTPDNVLHFRLLAELFPTARFIHIVRDGRDCLVSAWFHNLRVNAKALHQLYPTLDVFAAYFAPVWAENVAAGARFAAEQPDRCVALRYEDLSRDPLPLLDALCGFLGVDRDPDLLRACCEAAAFTRLSGGRAPGTEDRGSFFRRGLPGGWRDHLGAEIQATFHSKAGSMLAGFRYL
jgi:hypothetical protein